MNWEQGKISPDVDSVERLCSLYKVSPNELLGWEPCELIEEFKDRQAQALQELESLKAQKADIEQRIKAYTELLGRTD